MTKPFLIGLTGTIGTGKSTVAAEFRRLGAHVVVGDELGRRALEESPGLLERIRERFGLAVFERDGKLNRAALGRIVFADREQSRWLTDLTFPRIHDLWRQSVIMDCSVDVLVFDAALIFEWGIESEFDLIVLVTASPQRVLERLEAVGKFSREEAEMRMAAQLTTAEKEKKAHVVIRNDGTPEQLRQAVRELWRNRISSKGNIDRGKT